ncbi:MAG TPA: hypothetical protein VJS92_18580 [Candidatus Polarisedimenticolaceae bacterium]|nr:hypothetical protein [Candidatus Polarisedimenticolaceae bacterium]
MNDRPILRTAACALAVGAASFSPLPAPVLSKTVDRKFPVGQFCPLESRAAAGADLSFVAAGTAARITFTVDNFKGTCSLTNVPCLTNANCTVPPAGNTCQRLCTSSFTNCTSDANCPAGERCGPWNKVALDDVTVVLKSVFDANLLSPSPFYQDCYFSSTPPGQSGGGTPNAPSYNFNAAGTSEIFLSLFDSSAALSGWTGEIAFDGTRSAPRVPAAATLAGLEQTGGALGVGRLSDGAVPVTASRVVTGLTPGQTYVIHGWWAINLADRLTITINTNACLDADGDGFVACTGCDPDPGQVCGDCNDGRPHCTTSCTDADGDTWCVGNDCNDGVASCTNDCATDSDTDGTPDCRDGCLDADRDGWGLPGGAGNSCLGLDCEEFNPLCNQDCTDLDGDSACLPADCADNNPSRYPGAPEVNDCADQQCPGEYGYGVNDETSGTSGFLLSKVNYIWPAQSGATSYQVTRSDSRSFSANCVGTTTTGLSWIDAAVPPSGGVYYYLNRPLAPCVGSWGQRWPLAPRSVCPGEICTNAVDDDADSLTDCADPDCAGDPACQPHVFSFTDTTADDIGTNAFANFLQPLTVSASDYIYFEIQEQGWNRNVAWCAQNAAFYRTAYLASAPTAGTASSGAWSHWRRAPSTGNAWNGPSATSLVNDFGDNCFGPYSWCSEQFAGEPQNCLFPDRLEDCEAYDQFTGACAEAAGLPWTVTIRIAPSRLAACGF